MGYTKGSLLFTRSDQERWEALYKVGGGSGGGGVTLGILRFFVLIPIAVER